MFKFIIYIYIYSGRNIQKRSIYINIFSTPKDNHIFMNVFFCSISFKKWTLIFYNFIHTSSQYCIIFLRKFNNNAKVSLKKPLRKVIWNRPGFRDLGIVFRIFWQHIKLYGFLLKFYRFRTFITTSFALTVSSVFS